MGAESAKKNKTNRTTAEARRVAKAAIRQLNAQKENKEVQENIAKLQTALNKKDEKLEGSNINDILDEMDIDEDGAGEAGDREDNEKTGEGSQEGKKSSNEKDDEKDEKGSQEGKKTSDGKDNEKDRKGSQEGKKTSDEKSDEKDGEGSQEGKKTRDEIGDEKDGKRSQEEKKDARKPEIKKERRDSGAIFTAQDEPDSNSIEESAELYEDDEYGAPLFYRPGPQRGEDVTTVGWTGGISTRYINRYGPKNAAKHRLDRFADSPEYEEAKPRTEQVSNAHNRYGDKTLASGTPEFTKRHIVAIYGVAWEGPGTEADLDLINPDLVQERINDWESGGRRGSKPSWPTTYLIIGWDVKGKIEKRWETRQALRKRWGNKDADKALFEAAYHAEDRYNEVISGERERESRSPSIDFAADTARHYREQSTGVNRASPSRATPTRATPTRASPSRVTPTRATPTRATPTRASRSPSPAATRFSKSKVNADTADQWKDALERFRISFCECAGVNSFQELSSIDKADFVEA